MARLERPTRQCAALHAWRRVTAMKFEKGAEVATVSSPNRLEILAADDTCRPDRLFRPLDNGLSAHP